MLNNRWLVLAVIFTCRVGLGFQFQTLGSVSGALIGEFGFTYSEIGTLIGLFMAPGVVLAVAVGYCGRYAPDRVLAAVGLAALALGGGLAAVSDSFGLIGLGRVFCGAGFVISTIYLAKMTTEWFAGKELATALSILVMSWPFGIAMGQIGHEWIADVASWRWAFTIASLYCLAGGLVILATYRPPETAPRSPTGAASHLSAREWTLTLTASLAWSLFNAGYVVFLSFAPQALVLTGHTPLQAASTISLASWVMIGSGALCGYLADRTQRPDLILYVSMTVAVAVLLVLPFGRFPTALALAFGLIAAAPAGVIMALTNESMAPQHRALGVGVFFTSYFIIMTPCPAIAGWLFDITGSAVWPLAFAALLFALTAISNAAFRVVQRRLGRPT